MNLGTDLSGIAHAVTSVIGDATTGAIAPRNAQVAGQGPPPFVSVIVPVYNGAEFLPEAIANILSQNYPSLEIIVVDDGSTDDIQTVVESLGVPVRLFRQENAGPSAARNRGIKDAAGEFLAFLDVDDLWPERNLATLVDALRANPEAAVVHGHAQLMERDADTHNWVFVGNPVDAFAFYIGAGIYRRTAFERVGLFDAELRFAEDTDWYPARAGEECRRHSAAQRQPVRAPAWQEHDVGKDAKGTQRASSVQDGTGPQAPGHDDGSGTMILAGPTTVCDRAWPSPRSATYREMDLQAVSEPVKCKPVARKPVPASP